MKDNERLVTVCDACFCATCWHGIFLCQKSRDAGIIKKSIAELTLLNAEHPSYWNKEHLSKYGDYAQ